MSGVRLHVISTAWLILFLITSGLSQDSKFIEEYCHDCTPKGYVCPEGIYQHCYIQCVQRCPTGYYDNTHHKSARDYCIVTSSPIRLLTTNPATTRPVAPKSKVNPTKITQASGKVIIRRRQSTKRKRREFEKNKAIVDFKPPASPKSEHNSKLLPLHITFQPFRYNSTNFTRSLLVSSTIQNSKTVSSRKRFKRKADVLTKTLKQPFIGDASVQNDKETSAKIVRRSGKTFPVLRNHYCMKCHVLNCSDCTKNVTECLRCNSGFELDGKGDCELRSTIDTNQTTPDEDDDDDTNTAALAGGIVGGVIGFILVFVLVLIIVFKTKRRGNTNSKMRGGCSVDLITTEKIPRSVRESHVYGNIVADDAKMTENNHKGSNDAMDDHIYGNSLPNDSDLKRSTTETTHNPNIKNKIMVTTSMELNEIEHLGVAPRPPSDNEFYDKLDLKGDNSQMDYTPLNFCNDTVIYENFNAVTQQKQQQQQQPNQKQDDVIEQNRNSPKHHDQFSKNEFPTNSDYKPSPSPKSPDHKNQPIDNHPNSDLDNNQCFYVNVSDLGLSANQRESESRTFNNPSRVGDFNSTTTIAKDTQNKPTTTSQQQQQQQLSAQYTDMSEMTKPGKNFPHDTYSDPVEQLFTSKSLANNDGLKYPDVNEKGNGEEEECDYVIPDKLVMDDVYVNGDELTIS